MDNFDDSYNWDIEDKDEPQPTGVEGVSGNPEMSDIYKVNGESLYVGDKLMKWVMEMSPVCHGIKVTTSLGDHEFEIESNFN